MDSRDARSLFKQGQKRLDAPVTAADLDAAIAIFIQVFQLDPAFHRALGWQGYALVRKFTEGFAESDVLADALGLAQAACDGSPADYDNLWALAIAQLYTGDWNTADETYRLALDLDIDGSIHLLSDYAVAQVYGGDNFNALRNARKTKGFRDWHKWNVAWTYFFLGRCEFQINGDSSYFDLALDEIKSMVLRPGHPRYMSDAQLVVGAIHVLRGDLDEAREAMDVYHAGKPNWTLAQEMARSPFNEANPDGLANKDFWESGAGQALTLPPP